MNSSRLLEQSRSEISELKSRNPSEEIAELEHRVSREAQERTGSRHINRRQRFSVRMLAPPESRVEPLLRDHFVRTGAPVQAAAIAVIPLTL